MNICNLFKIANKLRTAPVTILRMTIGTTRLPPKAIYILLRSIVGKAVKRMPIDWNCCRNAMPLWKPTKMRKRPPNEESAKWPRYPMRMALSPFLIPRTWVEHRNCKMPVAEEAMSIAVAQNEFAPTKRRRAVHSRCLIFIVSKRESIVKNQFMS